jgi:hypothetical protein
MLRKLIAAVVVIAACGTVTAVAVAYASNRHGDLDAVKKATDKYHSLATAQRADYDRFVDTAGIACIDMPGMGAMGVHYVNGGLVGDGAINARTPEALVYAPDKAGKLHLAALEYLVLKDAWDTNHHAPPSLFGQQFMLTASPNRYGLPPFYSLHTWVWKHNPAGTFAMWNPKVDCSTAHDHPPATPGPPRDGPH